MALLDTVSSHLAEEKVTAEKMQAEAEAEAARKKADMATLVEQRVLKVEQDVHDKLIDIVAHASSPDHAVDEALRHVVQAHTKGTKPIEPPASNPAKPTQPAPAGAPAGTEPEPKPAEPKEPVAAADGKKVKKEPEKKPSLNEAIEKQLAAKGGVKCKTCAKKKD